MRRWVTAPLSMVVAARLDAVAEVVGEAADYQDGGGVEEDYVARGAWVAGEDAL